VSAWLVLKDTTTQAGDARFLEGERRRRLGPCRNDHRQGPHGLRPRSWIDSVQRGSTALPRGRAGSYL